MRTVFVCLLLLPGVAGAQSASIQGILEEIDKSSTIKIGAGNFDFSLTIQHAGKHTHYEEAYDGHELIVENKSNFTIQGAGAKKTHLLTQPQYGNVIVFRNCSNITIKDLYAGHGPEKGYCRGGVFYFENCKNINISGCDLYGSGIEGLHFENCANVNVSKTIIRECTYHILSAFNSSNINFKWCTFKDNQEFEQLNFMNAANVLFSKCKFLNNKAGVTFPDLDYYFIGIESSSVQFNGCTFKGNKADYFATKTAMISGFSKNKVDAGQFLKGPVPSVK